MTNPLTGIGLGLGLGVGYGVLSEYARLGILYAKWKATPYEWRIGKIAEALQSILSAEKDEVTGLSAKGAVDAIFSFIDKTLDFAWMTDEGIAMQMFVQMIQQSIAYAIHSSHAGSIGTMGNVYSGSMYLSGAEASSIGETGDLCSRGVRGFLSAEVGQNTPTIAFNLLRGANRRIDDVYRSMMRQTDGLLDEWNDLTLSYYRHYHSLCRERFADSIKMKESATDRAYGLLEQVCNEHLSRLVEQLDTLEGAKYWFDGNLMSADELEQVALRINLEVQASEDDFDSHKEAVLNAVDEAVEEWDTKINQALGDLSDSEYKFSLLTRSIFDTIFSDVVDFVQKVVEMCDRAVEDVCAYRNVKQSVKFDTLYELGQIETSPEVEVYRLMWRKILYIPPITIIYEYQRPRGLAWSYLEEIVVVEEAEPLPIRRVEEVDITVVKDYYEETVDIEWEDAGGG